MSEQNDPFGLVGHVLAQKYRVDAVVGEGGFGVVYRGFHLSFRHDVAVKCLRIPVEFAPDAQAEFVARFRDEGQHLSRLASAHMSIVRVFDFDIATSPSGVAMPYLVLEWLNGSSLDVVVAERGAAGEPPFDEREALALLRPAVEALAVAHELGVVHRDVKPANLFVAEGTTATIKVLDFGVAQAVGEAPRATTGFNPFSPLHGSPEQFSPKKFGATGPWTDVHALGLVLVEMVTGRHPLGDDDVGEMFLAATGEPRPTPRARGADVSDAFEAMCARALARMPEERFPNARALLAAMDAVAVGRELVEGAAPTLRDPPTDDAAADTVGAPGAAARTHGDKDLTSPYIPAWQPPRPGRWRRLRAGALAAVVVAVAAVGSLGWLGYRRHAAERARAQCGSGDLRACKDACDLGHVS
ncbi:MAG TPA: serine/threonine-protein kinase, partial [Byssovorax sp.]